MTSWDPSRYLQFVDERARPASDLLAHIPLSSPAQIIDLGCGTGTSTALLKNRWPNSDVEGLDNSEPMIAEAIKSGIAANWLLSDLETWQPQKVYDLVFSNAALQWLQDPLAAIPQFLKCVSSKGALAFQVPANYHAPSHLIAQELAKMPPWREYLRHVRQFKELSPINIYDLLKPQSGRVEIWQSEYLHELTGDDAVFRWISGTSLRPYIDALPLDQRSGFTDAYKKRLCVAYPRLVNGVTLFPFRRTFAVAIKD